MGLLKKKDKKKATKASAEKEAAAKKATGCIHHSSNPGSPAQKEPEGIDPQIEDQTSPGGCPNDACRKSAHPLNETGNQRQPNKGE